MHRYLTAALLLLALAGLLVALDADPSRLLWRDFITDEGWWTAEARDRALFANWVLDEYNQGLSVPLSSYAWFASFHLLGVSLWSARLPVVLAALLTLALLALMIRLTGRRRGAAAGSGEQYEMALPLKRDDGDAPPILPTLLLLASALPFAMFARIALPEIISLFFVMLAWALLAGPAAAAAADRSKTRGEPDASASADGGEAHGEAAGTSAPAAARHCQSWWLSMLVGLCFGAALSAKLSAMIAFPFLTHLACRRLSPERRFQTGQWRPAIHITFAAVLTWSLLRLPFSLRFPTELRVLDLMHRGENLPASLIDLLANISFFPWPSPFLYQVTPLLILAGFGAWRQGLRRGGGIASQALDFLFLLALAHALLGNPADRRFIIYLPALALLAALGWRAIVDGWEPKSFSLPVSPGRFGLWLRILGAALAAAFLLPGRLALWTGRALAALGRPLDDFQLRASAALLFLATLIAVLVYLSRRGEKANRVLRVSLLMNWILLAIEPFDFLIWAGLGQSTGRYDASRLWLETGTWFSLPWGLVSLTLLWLILARAGLIPRIGILERVRRPLVLAVPALAIGVLLNTWLTPTHTLRDAAQSLTGDLGESGVPLVVGAEAPSLILGSEYQAIPIRGEFNRAWRDRPPAGTRMLRLMEDSGATVNSIWPAGADTLGVCPQANGKPRFVFAVWRSD